jgi:rRNA maturation endonuclease Nob1
MDSGTGTSEHYVTRYVAGDIESVRLRLVDAVESMGYRIITESPMLAKRGARSGGQWGCSADILDYPTTLTIGLKSVGRNSTRVTFDYEVKNPFVTKGDKYVLTREAEALIAIATRRAIATSCAACGSEIVGDSRFCRQCGAPTENAKPAELEVLRLTAGAQVGYQWSILGFIFLLVALLLPLILFFKSSSDPERFMRAVRVIMILCATFGGLGMWGLLSGIRRLGRTLKPTSVEEPVGLSRLKTAPRTNELPPLTEDSVPVSSSVVEGTTDLLPAERRRTTSTT